MRVAKKHIGDGLVSIVCHDICVGYYLTNHDVRGVVGGLGNRQVGIDIHGDCSARGFTYPAVGGYRCNIVDVAITAAIVIEISLGDGICSSTACNKLRTPYCLD